MFSDGCSWVWAAYKYLPVSRSKHLLRIEAIISDHSIYYACPRSFNDPFDCRLRLSFGLPPAEVRTALEAIFASAEIDPAETLTESELDGIASLVSTPEGQKLLQTTVREQASNLGVVCLAERSDDLLMWAHYASAHTGVCIAFDTHAPPFSEAIDVQYSMTWPELAITGSHGDEAARKSLFTKPQAWSYENEWRLVENSFGLQPIDPNSVKGIIYGHRASESTVEALRKLCSTLKLPLQVATPSTGHYSLAITDAI